MAKIKVEAKIRNAGEALDLLRAIGLELNRGKVSGPNWALAEGEPEIPAQEIPNKAELDDLTDQLFLLVSDEDLDEVKLSEASEGLLPAIYDALRKAGYGSDEVATQAHQDKPGAPEAPKDDAEGPKDQNGAPEGKQEPTGDLYQFTKDWSDRKAGDKIAAADLGDGVILKDLLESGTIKKVVRFPWEA